MKKTEVRPLVGKILAGIILVIAQIVSDYYVVYLYDKWDKMPLYLLWWVSIFVAFITGMIVITYVVEYVATLWCKIFNISSTCFKRLP